MELHHADCPMTNADAEDRTACTCITDQWGDRDTPVGGVGNRVVRLERAEPRTSYEDAIDRLRKMGLGYMLPTRAEYEDRTQWGAVLVNRKEATQLADRADVHPKFPIALDCSCVAIMGVSFAHELLGRWPYAGLVNASEDIQAVWAVAADHR